MDWWSGEGWLRSWRPEAGAGSRTPSSPRRRIPAPRTPGRENSNNSRPCSGTFEFPHRPQTAASRPTKIGEVVERVRVCLPRRSPGATLARIGAIVLLVATLHYTTQGHGPASAPPRGGMGAAVSVQRRGGSVKHAVVPTVHVNKAAAGDDAEGQEEGGAEVEAKRKDPPMLAHVQCPYGKTLDELQMLLIVTGGRDPGWRWWSSIPMCWVDLHPNSAGWSDCYSGHIDHCLLHFLAENIDVLPAWIVVTTKAPLDWMDSVPKDLLFGQIPDAATRPQYLPMPSAFVRPTSLTPRTYFEKKALLDGITNAWAKMQKEYSGLEPLQLDQTLYCCSQFVVSGEAVRRHPPDFYRKLSSSISEFVRPHTAYPLEMLWHQAFLADPLMPGSTHLMVREWRTEALMTGCADWRCTCSGFSEMQFAVGAGKRAPSHIHPERMQQWWKHGGYGPQAYFQMDVDSPYLVEFYSRWSPRGRDKGGYGACEGSAMTVVRDPPGAPQGPGENAEGQLRKVKARTNQGQRYKDKR